MRSRRNCKSFAMGSLFRSEKMAFCEILFPSETVYECVSALGENGLVQFLDLNAGVSAFNRKFSTEVKICDELERDMRFFHSQIVNENIEIEISGHNPIAPRPKELLELEKLYRELLEVDTNVIALKNNYINFLQRKAILRRARTCFGDSRMRRTSQEVEDKEPGQLEEGRKGLASNFCFVGGTIEKGKLYGFEKVLWRVSKNNIIMFHGDMEGRPDDKFVNQQVDKISFIVCCQGEELTKKVKKVCEGYRAPTYMCPTKISDIRKSLIEVSHTINDLYKILTETEAHKNAVLKEGAKYIRNWLIEIRKMKGIFHTMNYFDIQQNETFVAHCWIPYSDIGDVYNTLYYNSVIDEINRDVKPVITEIDPLDNPPTYFKLNKFTKAFQKIIEAYGIASYREINPTLFTIITFPFLFGVMFGDMGHATIMTLFATVLIIKEKKYLHTVIENEIFKMLFGGRYVILLMGIFSFYIGFIYNDIFSISMNIFGTTWRVNYDKSTLKENELLQLNPSSDDFLGKPPPFGLDPMWKHSVNDIDRTNVLKMKVSIIIGVLQMFFGICLSLVNHIYFKNYLSIYCEFIPQVIFFLSLFGYLVALIFIKWVTFGPKFDIASSPHCAPSILITFIGMILMKKMEIPEGCERDMYAGQVWYSLVHLSNENWPLPYEFPHMSMQSHVLAIMSENADLWGTYQKILVGLAVACVPWMLIMKPVILIRRLKNKTKKVEGTESEEPSEIFIHQCIHTIEFVLGSVSYTASYLRLWALSLAHGQLAEVLWSRVMKAGFTRFEILGGVFVYIAFACWAGLTVSIMVVMEGLSAFLHALRLHWMEFQSKFYAGQGHYFEPFTSKQINEDVDNLMKVR